MRFTSSVWETPGLMKALRGFAALGVHSAAELTLLMNERFSLELSRNAIMGKCWREGIPLREKRGTIPCRTRTITRRPPPPKAELIKRSALLQCDEPEPRGDVADGCRWLHGPAEDRLFCGAPTVRWGISWCHHHCARVWNPATPAQVAKFAKFVTWRAA